MTEESDLEKYRPRLTEMTVVKAAQTWGEGGEIVSLNGQRAALDSFILLLATDTQALGPFLLNKVCARELYALLAAGGFGPPSS